MTDYPYTYAGDTMHTTNNLRFTKLWQTFGGQDGAMFGDWIIRFDAKGNGHVFRISEEKEVCTFRLGSADKIVPHANAVVFGTEYLTPGDEFPLLYSNIYNNYAKSDDRLEGTVCVYRLTRNETEFSADKKKYLAHTLNNTVVAPPRMLIAFLENNLQADGTVKIPEVLRPYMGGQEVLVPKK